MLFLDEVVGPSPPKNLSVALISVLCEIFFNTYVVVWSFGNRYAMESDLKSVSMFILFICFRLFIVALFCKYCCQINVYLTS